MLFILNQPLTCCTAIHVISPSHHAYVHACCAHETNLLTAALPALCCAVDYMTQQNQREAHENVKNFFLNFVCFCLCWCLLFSFICISTCLSHVHDLFLACLYKLGVNDRQQVRPTKTLCMYVSWSFKVHM